MPDTYPKLPPLTDPNHPKVDIVPSDYNRVIPSLTPDEQAKVDLVENAFIDCVNARKTKEGVWYESLAYYLGNQTVEWKPGLNGGELGLMSDFRNMYRSRTTRNRLRARLRKLVANAMRARIDASARPLTAREVDMLASKEARSLLAHTDRLFDRQSQTKQVLKYAATTTTCYLKIYFNPNVEVDLPDGKGGVYRAAKGELVEDIVPFTQWYPDPKATVHDELTYGIHAKSRSLEYVKSNYPDGWMVGADSMSGIAGIAEQRMAATVGDPQRRNTPGARNSVIVKEMWRLPCADCPKGALITVAGGRLLRDEPWPFTKWKKLPFIPMSFEDGIDSTWGLNALQDAINPQRDYNAMIQRMRGYLKTFWGKIMAPIGCEIPPGSFNGEKENEVVYYQPGPGEPKPWTPPPLSPVVLEFAQMAIADIDDAMGVHDISQGIAPRGVTANSALQTLAEQDATQNADVVTNLEKFHKMRAECEIAIAAQFYQEPRLIAIQDTDDGDDNKQGEVAEAMTFRALAEGRVVVDATSQTNKTPQALAEQIMQMFANGMFLPDNLPSTIVMLKQLGIDTGQQVYDQLLKVAIFQQEQIEKARPDPAKVAAMQAEAQQKQQAAQQAAAAMQQQQDQAHAAAVMEAQDHAERNRSDRELAAIQLKADNDLRAKQTATLAPATPDPTATVAIEAQYGLPGEVPTTPKPTGGK